MTQLSRLMNGSNREDDDMFLFVTGGTASGKSEYAEQQAERIAAVEAAERGEDEAVIIYAATMSDSSADSVERIKRHRRRRSGKGIKIHRNGVFDDASCSDEKNVKVRYETFECFSIADAERLAEYAEGRVVLFDCFSGFAANVMFSEPDDASGDPHRPPRPLASPKPKQQVAAALEQTAAALSRRCSSLIIVSDVIFSDGCSYDKYTLDYIDALAAASRTAAAAADTAVEVVCGIPVRLK